MASDTLKKTTNQLIFVACEDPLTREEVETKLAVLREAVAKAEDPSATTVDMRAVLKSLVPTYHDPDEVNRRFEDSPEKKKSESQDAPD